MRTFFVSILLLMLTCPLVSCQTSRAVLFDYHEATYGGDHYKESEQTSVLFLIDGLSSDMLRTSLENSNVPSIAKAFTLSTKARFAQGRATFPSLTFPNLTSILTGSTIAQHPVIGNRVFIDGSVLNFETVSNWPELARLTQRRTIFSDLAAKSETSVSFAYAFSGAATASQQKSVSSGFSYLEEDFASVDLSTIESLKRLLTETQVSKWPRFIFVHLIGVDATAHHRGPLDESVQSYLHQIDASLGEIFEILDHPTGLSHSNRIVTYALTSDHGFKTTPDHSPLEDVAAKLKYKVRLIADNRVAPLYIDQEMGGTERLSLAKALLDVPHVGWAALKVNNGIDLLRRSGQHARISFHDASCRDGGRAAHFEWLSQTPDDKSEYSKRGPEVFTCVDQFDLATGPNDDSYIVPALVDYFANPASPDMVFIPDDHSDFVSGNVGNHGGLTRDEMLVPILTKDIALPRGIHPTSELLRLMGFQK